MGFSFGPLNPIQVAVLAGPAAAPPPGIEPFSPKSHPQVVEWMTIAICVIVVVLAVAMRLFSRIAITKPLHVEDFCIIVALAAHISLSMLEAVMVKHGIGKHMWDITLGEFLHAAYYLQYTNGLYCLEMFCIKLAIPLQFLRLFVSDRRLNRPLWITCWLSIIINALFYAPNIFIQIFICSPLNKAWNPFIKDGHCLDYQAILRATGVFNIISDFALLILPIWGILQLPVKIQKKMAVGSVFATGFFACVAPVVRTYYTWNVIKMRDKSFTIRVQGYTTQVELTLGLLVFCVPSAPQFVQFLRGKISPSTLQQRSDRTDVERASWRSSSKDTVQSDDSTVPMVKTASPETSQSTTTITTSDTSSYYFHVC